MENLYQEEIEESWKKIVNAHWCKKCDGKIVCISLDNLGNVRCGYCNTIVKYPKLNKEIFEKWLKER